MIRSRGPTSWTRSRAAHELRGVLNDAGLVGYPKTSGGRGVHVFVPIEPTYGFVEARHAVIALGRELARRMPDHVTISWWKEERGRRIFVDFNQMARDRTIASAYSIRPTPNAQVSAPLSWEELDDVAPEDFTVTTMRDRFARHGDVWSDFYDPNPPSSTWRSRCSNATSVTLALESTEGQRCLIRLTTPRCRASRPGCNRAG